MSTSAMRLGEVQNIAHPYAEFTLAEAIQLAKNYQSLHGEPEPISLADVRAVISDMAKSIEHLWVNGMVALDLLDAAIDGKDPKQGRYRRTFA